MGESVDMEAISYESQTIFLILEGWGQKKKERALIQEYHVLKEMLTGGIHQKKFNFYKIFSCVATLCLTLSVCLSVLSRNLGIVG